MELQVKHGTQSSRLHLQDGECVYARLSYMYDVPVARLKLLRGGKQLPPAGDQALPAALAQPGTIMVMGTRHQEQLPTASSRAAADVYELWHSITLESFKRRGTALLMWLWQLVSSSGRLAISFVSSALLPSSAATPPAADPWHED